MASLTMENNTLKKLSNNFGFFIAPLFILVAFIVAFIYFKVWPFGEYIIASYDQLAQVCPVIEHYLSVLDGTSGLFHTFYAGGGMDVFGILAFCTISPFTFIFLLGGQGYSIYLVSIVLPLKVASSSLTALLFVKKIFPNLHHGMATVLAILYAFGGYLYVSNTYINWTDLMIYMPILGMGFIKFVREQKIALLSFSLAIMIYTCFSITCFSFFLTFPIMISYVFICVDKDVRKQFLSKLCLAFAIAIIVSLPILLPSFMVYMNAGRNTGLFSKLFTTSIDDATPLYEKFSYICCDSTFIFLSAIYFITSKKNDKLSTFLFIALVITLIPCIVDESMLLLNAGSYNSYALRFGFLIDFLLFYIACYSLDNLDKKCDKTQEKLTFKSAIFMILTAGLVCFGVLFTYKLFNFIAGGKDFSGNNFESGKPFYSYFSAFAHSEGGLEGTSILLGVIVVIFVIATIFVKFKFIKLRDAICFLCVLALSQTIFFDFSLIKGNTMKESAGKFDSYSQIISKINENDDEFYRMKSYNYYISSDSPFILRNYSFTLFSSMADAKNITAPNFFQYAGNSTNSTKSNGGSMFADCVMGYKYVVYSSNDSGNATLRNYLDSTEIYADNYKVFLNSLCLPSCCIVEDVNLSFDGLNHIEKLQKLYTFLGGEGSLYTEITPTITKNDEWFKISYKCTGKCDFYYSANFPTDYEMKEKNGDSEKDLANYSSFKYFSSPTTKTIYIRRANGELTEEDILTYFKSLSIEESTVEKLKNIMEANAVKFYLGKNSITFDKITANEGQKLYLNYVNLSGYKVYVNGKEKTLEDNGLDFIIFELDEGENDIEIKYYSPYIKYALIGLFATILLGVLLYLAVIKFKFIYLKVENIIAIAGVVLACALVGFFIIFPTGVYLYKLIAFII